MQYLSDLVSAGRTDSPRLGSDGRDHNSSELVIRDSIQISTATAGDTIILSPIFIEAVISSLDITTNDIGDSAQFIIGFYQPNYSGANTTFTAISTNCISNVIDLATDSGQCLGPQRFNSLDEDTSSAKVWEIAELTEKPKIGELYFGITIVSGTLDAGIISLDCSFTK